MNASACQTYPKAGSRTGSAAAIVAAALSGCATVDSVQADGQLVRHYIGYVRIATLSPEAGRPVHASDLATFGLRISDGVSVGYTRDKSVVVPLDCRLVVLVATAKQLNDAMEKLSLFKDAPGICAAVSPTLQTGDIP